MYKKRKILIVLGILILILILSYFFISKKTYTNKAYGFSFKYPHSWKKEIKSTEGLKETVFTDRRGNTTLNLQTPYDYISQEVGDLIESKDYQTNDPQTVLHYEVYDAFAPGQKDSIYLAWQQGCLQGHCDANKDAGGMLIIPLKDKLEDREQQLKELDNIINSFRVLKD